jgi:hypothetical protein
MAEFPTGRANMPILNDGVSPSLSLLLMTCIFGRMLATSERTEPLGSKLLNNVAVSLLCVAQTRPTANAECADNIDDLCLQMCKQ